MTVICGSVVSVVSELQQLIQWYVVTGTWNIARAN